MLTRPVPVRDRRAAGDAIIGLVIAAGIVLEAAAWLVHVLGVMR